MKKQREKSTADGNLRKIHAWKSVSFRQRSIVQSDGYGLTGLEINGESKYFRIVVRPSWEFVTFRIQNVGDKGHIERLAGKRESGGWDTQAWLISKKDAHIEDGRLVADTIYAQQVINILQTEPDHIEGDIFKARDRYDVPEKNKPTLAQIIARKQNIQKAQSARWE